MPPRSARRAPSARTGREGFIGNATDATAHWFGQERGLGTMPHALIGYAGSTVRAAEMFHETFPDEPLTVLVDYFGARGHRRRWRSAAASPSSPPPGGCRCGSTPMAAASSRGSTRRSPTPCWSATRRGDPPLPQRDGAAPPGRHRRLRRRDLAMREALDEAGFPKVRIVASSGFGAAKCRVMAEAKAPIDVVGTGSFLPRTGPRPTPPPTSSTMTARRA